MLKSKHLGSDKELMSIREKNMQKWSDEDHQFYGEFFDDLPLENKKSSHKSDGFAEQKQAAFAEEAWHRFQQLLKELKNQPMG